MYFLNVTIFCIAKNIKLDRTIFPEGHIVGHKAKYGTSWIVLKLI